MRRWAVVFALLVSVGLNVGIGVALLRRHGSGPLLEDRPGGGPERSSRRLPPGIFRLADELGLEGERRDAFLDLQEDFLARTFAARDAVRGAQTRLRTELTRPEPDREAADRLLVELSAAHLELERVFVDSLFEARSLLEPDEARLYLRFVLRHREQREEVLRRFREGPLGREGLPGRFPGPRRRPPG